MPVGTGSGQSGLRQSGQRSGRGKGRGMRGGGGIKSGPGGECLCLSCGSITAHEAGVPCYQVKCPKCGLNMTRR